MNKWRIIIAILLAALSILAIGVSLNAVIFGGRVDLALVSAVILLSLSQLISLFNRTGSKQKTQIDINDLMLANQSIGQNTTLLRRRLERVEAKLYSEQAATTEQLDAQVQALEHSVSALTKQRYSEEMKSNLREEPVVPASSMSRQLDLYLQPVVRLSDSRTAYYRASLAIRGSDQEQSSAATAMREAERAGSRGELDLAVFELAVPVIRRLQQKRRTIAVFCPVSASSFADDGFIGSLIELLGNNRDVANDLVIEISQLALSRLNEKGQEGLAHLAHLGATFALSNIQRDVPNLMTLSELGFAFILADIRLLVAVRREGGREASLLFDQAAQHNLQVIAADIVKQSEYAWIDDVVPLAYGGYFSPPRLVRHDITVAQPTAQVA